MTKICTKCQQEKPLDCFWKHSSCRHGVMSQCKACRKHYHQQHYTIIRDVALARSKKWYKDNKERAQQNAKQYQREHRQQQTLRMREYRQRLVDKMTRVLADTQDTITLDRLAEQVGYSQREVRKSVTKVDEQLLKRVELRKRGEI